eukprot:gene43830-53597_t
MALVELKGKMVSIITNDGRNILGVLRGFDQTINVILEHSHERVFSDDKGVEQNPLGLYMIRGDNIAVVGELDEEADSRRDLNSIQAAPLNAIAHS